MSTRNRTSSKIIGYDLYLYFLGLSFRSAAKALSFLHIIKISHLVSTRKEEGMIIYWVYKENRPTTSKQVVNVFDLGYLGVEKDYPEQISSIPQRKKRNLDLSAEERYYSKDHSKRRIVIEHTTCRLKKYRILSDVFRNELRKHNKVSDIVSGLVNYRIMNHYC
jgi:hypothetical protein